MRLAWLLVLAAACATDDDRPLTVQYVTDAILRPDCGGAACHSSFASNRGLIFDTVDGVRQSLGSTVAASGIPLVSLTDDHYDPDMPGNADLIRWLTETDPDNKGIGRMPYDAPMPNEDVLFLEKWIGAAIPGASCDPSQAMACNKDTLVMCNADWTFGATVMQCPTSCMNGICQ